MTSLGRRDRSSRAGPACQPPQIGAHDVEGKPTPEIIDDLMDKKPELRLRFIQENAKVAEELDV